MNTEFILKVADKIERDVIMTNHKISEYVLSDYYFTMDDYFYICGSPANIAGHAIALGEDLGLIDSADFEKYSDDELFARLFDLPEETAQEIIFPTFWEIKRWKAPVTPEWKRAMLIMKNRRIGPGAAVEMLRKLAETGEVDWEGIMGGKM